MILQTEGASIATRSMSTSVDGNGDFCFKVAAGIHTIQVGLSSCQLTFESNFIIGMVFLTMLSNWLTKVMPLCQPVRSKIKANHNLLAHDFPCLMLVTCTCICFDF